MKLYTTPSYILTKAWALANSECWLAFGQTESYSVQPRLLLAAMIWLQADQEYFLLSPASILDVRPRLYSSEFNLDLKASLNQNGCF